ncbi:MAG: hypothetical protein ACXVP0_15125 [Bacteroidia bacterium]
MTCTALVKSVLPDGNLEILDNFHLKIGLVDKIKGKDPTWQQLKNLYGKSIAYLDTAGFSDNVRLIEILYVEELS